MKLSIVSLNMKHILITHKIHIISQRILNEDSSKGAKASPQGIQIDAWHGIKARSSNREEWIRKHYSNAPRMRIARMHFYPNTYRSLSTEYCTSKIFVSFPMWYSSMWKVLILLIEFWRCYGMHFQHRTLNGKVFWELHKKFYIMINRYQFTNWKNTVKCDEFYKSTSSFEENYR